jgi:hypothetical protein
MRRIAQPNPGPAERIQWLETRGRRVEYRLPAGRCLLEAVAECFATSGFRSGVLNFEDGALGPLAYVIPARSKTGQNAAFYSERFLARGASRIRAGAVTFGTRQGAPFLHCHAVWTDADGHLRGGHILPEETVIAEAIRASGVGLVGTTFAAEPDLETNFTLFGPIAEPVASSPADQRFFALRLRPNQDLAHALESFCRQRGLAGAVLHGGVGSIIGARFTGGLRVDAFATEMAIRAGRIGRDLGGALAARVDAALVDLTGVVSEGCLVRGDNPILMTLEVVLEPDGEDLRHG